VALCALRIGVDASAVAAEPREERRRDSRLSVYVPPSRGAVGVRTGGGTRGGADAPRIEALAPDHIGWTTRAQPVLAWYLSRDTDVPIVVSIIADGAIEPLLEAPLPGSQRAGIHLVDLAALGAELEAGATYDWSVAIVVDPGARDADVVAGGAVQRVKAAPELSAALAQPGPSHRALARHGIWYDAIADLSTAIAAAPEDAALRAERADLLEQVGLGDAAAFDREGGDAAKSAD
jgi:hypothetical protein